MAQDVRGYSEASGAKLDEAARAGAGRWTEALSERPHYFPLFIEFWAYAVREPRTRERFAERVAAFRLATGQIVAAGAAARGIELEPESVERLGLFVNALANGLALERLVCPATVPDEFFGHLPALVFSGFEALVDQRTARSGT